MPGLSHERLLDLAGRKSFDRGLDYLGRVSGLREGGGAVHATVGGQRRYRVRITTEGSFSWHCGCPWAEEGNCCKHVVAVGLTHLYECEHGGTPPSAPDVASYLYALDHERLVELLLEEADRSPSLALALEARAAVAAGDPEALRTLLESALRTTEPVPYEQAAEYARVVHYAVDAVRELERSGRAEAAGELLDAVLALTDEAEEMVEDLDGEVRSALERLRGLRGTGALARWPGTGRKTPPAGVGGARSARQVRAATARVASRSHPRYQSAKVRGAPSSPVSGRRSSFSTRTSSHMRPVSGPDTTSHCRSAHPRWHRHSAPTVRSSAHRSSSMRASQDS
ncbi:SWIM zinc finger family protein [Nocardiopsis sp. FR6]|uniref:SWIM zinc finger family protein n=1 Tax=Nocardiopsis sp. FR6 TaxID=2605986 RepID=UPI001F20FBBF|nr:MULTISPECIES: SWIM zinc finger family protein [unclassified Nocardiopsis]